MKINWNENPLWTTITLSDADKETLRLKWKVDTLQNVVWTALFHLKEGGQYFDPKEAYEELDRYASDDWDQSSYFSDLVYVLENSGHVGDCTCVPATCFKCVAEDVLGISTIEGLGKHSAAKISSAFSNGASIDEVIATLADYTPAKGPSWERYSQEAFDAHVPRWKAEAKAAHDWLVSYREEHFRPAPVNEEEQG